MRSPLYAFAILLALGSLTSLTAQPSMADWERAKAFTMEYLEAMPEESYDLKPTPEIRSFAEQMLHLADGNFGFASAALGESSPLDGRAEQMEDKSMAKVVEVVMQSYDFILESLQGKDASAMEEMVTLFGRFEMTRAMALEKAFEHQTHHRGQATIYLRLAGVQPPNEKLF